MKAKWSWCARQIGHRDTWRLKLCIGNKDYPVKGAVLTMGDVRKITGADEIEKTVFIHQE